MPTRSVMPDLKKKIMQEIPRLHNAAANLRRYGMGRSEIMAKVRKAMNDAED